jgi:uncharacterized protein
MPAGPHEPADEATGAGRFPAQAPIDAYGNGGFRFAGMSHRGSMLCLPSAMIAWDVGSMDALRPEHLADAIAQRDHIDVLLLGTGGRQVFPTAALREICRDAGFTLEAMSTGSACRTYNILLAERRRVAAALIAVP